MEYLSNIDQPLKKIGESGIQYFNILKDFPYLLYGIPLFSVHKELVKFSYETMEEMENGGFSEFGNEQYKKVIKNDFNNNAFNTSGCCIRFKTHSNKIIIKASLKRRWDYLKMNLWCSSGFDVYERRTSNKRWIHKTVVGPNTGGAIFAEKIDITCDLEYMIFLPLYNQIYELLIGSNEPIEVIEEYKNPIPIVFYGNSITQGASASRSGNAFCNIVSRKLDSAIVNYSASSGAHGQLSVARTIGSINISAIVIDYSRNAYNEQDLYLTHEKFYMELRKYHPNIPVIFLTTVCTNFQISYQNFDHIIYETYNHAKARGENVFIINVMELTKKIGYDVTTVDGAHLTDAGMFLVADAISEILSKELNLQCVE